MNTGVCARITRGPRAFYTFIKTYEKLLGYIKIKLGKKKKAL